jgi:hypothetical protein
VADSCRAFDVPVNWRRSVRREVLVCGKNGGRDTEQTESVQTPRVFGQVPAGLCEVALPVDKCQRVSEIFSCSSTVQIARCLARALVIFLVSLIHGIGPFPR